MAQKKDTSKVHRETTKSGLKLVLNAFVARGSKLTKKTKLSPREAKIFAFLDELGKEHDEELRDLQHNYLCERLAQILKPIYEKHFDSPLEVREQVKLFLQGIRQDSEMLKLLYRSKRKSDWIVRFGLKVLPLKASQRHRNTIHSKTFRTALEAARLHVESLDGISASESSFRKKAKKSAAAPLGPNLMDPNTLEVVFEMIFGLSQPEARKLSVNTADQIRLIQRAEGVALKESIERLRAELS
jgi:hypothetical protein